MKILDLKNNWMTEGKKRVELTPRQTMIIAKLANNYMIPGKDIQENQDTLRDNIKKLRKKGFIIQNLYGAGYRLKDQVWIE